VSVAGAAAYEEILELGRSLEVPSPFSLLSSAVKLGNRSVEGDETDVCFRANMGRSQESIL
jgi:hypothetical protein